MFLAITKKLSIRVESLHFLMFTQNAANAKINNRDGHAKLINGHGQIFCQVCGNPETLWGSGLGVLPIGKNRPSVASADCRRCNRGQRARSKWSLGFDSWLVLGSPRVKVQQK